MALLPGATVTMFRWDNTTNSFKLYLTTTTDAVGGFYFYGVSPSEKYVVSFYKDGYILQYWHLGAPAIQLEGTNPITPPEGSWSMHPILEGGTALTGTVNI